ncbi:hypothetical protein HX747_30875 [Streptomyces sp. L06]|nr:hypothetical protein [Streptomyces sp. L06]
MYDAASATPSHQVRVLERFTSRLRPGGEAGLHRRCLLKAVEATGTAKFRGVQAQIGEVLNWRDMFWGCRRDDRSPDWSADRCSQLQYGWRTHFMGVGYPGSGRSSADLRQCADLLNSHSSDWRNPTCGLLDGTARFHGVEAIDRVKLLKLLWDAVGSEFAPHELYERNYGATTRASASDADGHQANGRRTR